MSFDVEEFASTLPPRPLSHDEFENLRSGLEAEDPVRVGTSDTISAFAFIVDGRGEAYRFDPRDLRWYHDDEWIVDAVRAGITEEFAEGGGA